MFRPALTLVLGLALLAPLSARAASTSPWVGIRALVQRALVAAPTNFASLRTGAMEGDDDYAVISSLQTLCSFCSLNVRYIGISRESGIYDFQIGFGNTDKKSLRALGEEVAAAVAPVIPASFVVVSTQDVSATWDRKWQGPDNEEIEISADHAINTTDLSIQIFHDVTTSDK